MSKTGNKSMDYGTFIWWIKQQWKTMLWEKFNNINMTDCLGKKKEYKIQSTILSIF